MTRLKGSEFGCVESLLDAVPFNVLLAKAVMDGTAHGSIVVDKLPKPKACYIQHQYGMAFLVGHTKDERFRAALLGKLSNATAERSIPEYLQVYPARWEQVLDPFVAQGRIKDWGRSNFRFEPSRNNNVEPAVDPTAEEGQVFRADRTAISTFRGAVIPERFWNSLDRFLTHGVAFRHSLPTNPGVTTALAFSAYRDGEHLELGVETAPEFRGRGYGRMVCRALIQYCLEAGLEPIWSCRTENQGSFRLALSLGFREITRHPYYELPYGATKHPGP